MSLPFQKLIFKKNKLQKYFFHIIFSYIIFFKSIKKYGIKIALRYFFDVILFDLIYRIDTSQKIYKHEYHLENNISFYDGMDYMASWSSQIKNTFNFLSHLQEFEKYRFIDIGCGKGKVLIEWCLLLKKFNLKQKVLGIDYYLPLIHVAKSNFFKVLGREEKFVFGDATKYNFNSQGSKLIIYMFNPFGPRSINKLLKNIKKKDVLFIYNNPVHANIFNKTGYELVYEFKGPCAALTTIIFKKR
jgi:hypothetical protein